VGDNLRLVGYDLPGQAAPGQTLNLALYWEATGAMPDRTYVGFAHVLDAKTMELLAQDDHLLGQNQYPVNAWQLGDLVVDHYALALPAGLNASGLLVQVGAYTWPDVVRLAVPGYPDNVIVLKPVGVR
jgi:hypothetical protein